MRVPELSVIIPTYNRRRLIERTLPTVLDQSLPHDRYEVVVVADGSRDGTGEYLKGLRPTCELIVLEQEWNRGPGAAKNFGLSAARGDIVLFLDDDLLCDRALLAAHLHAHDAPGRHLVVGALTAQLDGLSPVINQRWVEGYKEWVERAASLMPGSWPVDLSMGTNSSVAKAEIARVGGFDESLSRAFEDLDLALRLRSCGVRFRFQPAARACHLYNKSAETRVRDAQWAGKNSVLLARAHQAVRPHICHSRLAEGAWSKRKVRSLAARLPFSPDPLLGLAFRICERFAARPPLGWAARELLTARIGIASLRAGVKTVGSWPRLRQEFGMHASMLVYHHVGPKSPGRYYPGLSIEPARFERQISLLARWGYRSIRPSDWLAWVRCAKPLPAKPIFIAFDDGHADVATYALPILQRYGFNAVINVVTGFIGDFSRWDTGRGLTARPLMSVEQMLYWKSRGFEFASHSRTHPDLTLLGEAELIDEISGSYDDLAGLVGSAPISFTYPYGSTNDRVTAIAASCYPLVFGLGNRLNHLAVGPGRMRRTEVKASDTILDLWWRAHLGWSAREAVMGRVSAMHSRSPQRDGAHGIAAPPPPSSSR